MNLRKVGGIIAVANHEVAKPLLQVGAIPIIRRIVITYQQVGVFPIVVVVGGDDEDLKRELSALGVIFLKHEQDRTPELMDSVRTGLHYLQGKCSRVVFTPVNVPMFTPDTLQNLLGTAGEIVVPSWQGRGGHPIILSDEMIPRILSYSGENGLRGDLEKAFAEADKVYVEEFETGYLDQAYIECQGMMAEPEADGRMFVHGSMQCAYYVHGAVARVLGVGPEGVHVLQDVTGGGFGGKEAFPSILGSQVAVAAKKAGKAVRCTFDRDEDLEFSSKRHPSLNTYKIAVKDGKVTAMDIDVKFNGGAYTTLSAVVLQRGIIAASGVYNVENLHVRGRALKTNTTPSGAYRGFGAPQTFFSAEMFMNHIAQDLGVDSIDFKLANVVKQGDGTSTSGIITSPCLWSTC